MKVIEKLAETWVDPFTAEDEEMPLSGYAADIAESAYIAGFLKAREMAQQNSRNILKIHNSNPIAIGLIGRMLENLGESEV